MISDFKYNGLGACKHGTEIFAWLLSLVAVKICEKMSLLHMYMYGFLFLSTVFVLKQHCR